MNLDELIANSSRGAARFLAKAKEKGYVQVVADKGSHFNDAFTIAYGVGEETYMLVYDVIAGAKKYPTKNTVRNETGLKGRFDMKKLRVQGLENIKSEMSPGNITPFLSEDFDIGKLHVVIDQFSVEENIPIKFPAGNSNYLAMTPFDVFQTLRSLYGKERVAQKYLFYKIQAMNMNLR